MDSDPAHYMTNLILYYYKNKWLKTQKREMYKKDVFCQSVTFCKQSV